MRTFCRLSTPARADVRRSFQGTGYRDAFELSPTGRLSRRVRVRSWAVLQAAASAPPLGTCAAVRSKAEKSACSGSNPGPRVY